MGKQRSPEHAGLPEGLYYRKQNGKYFMRYRGVYRGFGVNREDALSQFARAKAEIGATDRRLVSVQIDLYLLRAEQKLRPSTYEQRVRMAEVYKRRIGRYHMASITEEHLSDMFDKLTPHAHKAHRNFWIEVYKTALSRGVVKANRAANTLPPVTPKRQRERLSEADYDAIYAIAPDWMQIAMEIAVTTLLRRGDLWRARKADVGREWKVAHAKTGKEVVIGVPPGSRLEAAVRRAKAYPIATPYLITNGPVRGGPEMLTRHFTRLAKQIGSTATFHELKSLGKELYDKKFGKGAATVLAQWNERTEMIYADGRDAPFQEAGL